MALLRVHCSQPLCLAHPKGNASEASAKHAGLRGGVCERSEQEEIFFSIPTPHPVKSSFCAGVLFSREPIRAFNDRMKLRGISTNLLAFYHECRSLIGYTTQYLFCDR